MFANLPSDFPEASLTDLIRSLQNLGFETHLTSLGGPGLGILQTSGEHIEPTSATDAVPTSEEGVGMVVPKRAALRDAGVGTVAAWAGKLEPWAYT